MDEHLKKKIPHLGILYGIAVPPDFFAVAAM